MARLGIAAVVLVGLAPVGCNGGESSDSGRDRTSTETKAGGLLDARPALCSRLRARVVGSVATGAATELSGLALSRTQAGVLWTHNDSGDSARVFAVALDGRLLAEVAVTGAEHIDWEDLAIGPGPDGDWLYVGDIGDNGLRRSAVAVYRVQEPRLDGGAPSATAPAERLTLRYPDGAHDAEALLVDPSSGALTIVTKSFGGSAGVYVAGRPSTGALRRAGKVSLEIGQAVTAGSVSADGRTIALRTYDSAFVWSRRRGESLPSALRRRPCAARADLLAEGQGETLALTRDGRAFYTVPEGGDPPLRRYAPAARR
jgi:hypothetical protein